MKAKSPNRTRIGWCDLTINPITGCLNGCDFCYARRFATRLAGRFGYPKDEPFRPTFHEDKARALMYLRGNGRRVFLDSMGDWFSTGVEFEWIRTVIWLLWQGQNQKNWFFVLTKRPENIDVLEDLDIMVPPNLFFGVSVTCQDDVWRIRELKNNLPNDENRGFCHSFVSFEPLHGPIQADLSGIEWVIIGAQTGPKKIVPEKSWIDDLIDQANQIPVFLKDNLWPIAPKYTEAQLWLAGKRPKLRQQFPEAMQR